MEFVSGILHEILYIGMEMAPYLLFGFFIAGVLHVVVPQDKILQHLSQNNIGGVVKASLFGVPLPLCSCGVIPVAAGLRKDGAGKGPTISFLTSTPTTGVDSIMATYALLGPLFAVIRPVVAFIAGITAGLLVNKFDKEHSLHYGEALHTNEVKNNYATLASKAKGLVSYAFSDLIFDIGKWIVIGIVLGGVISYLIPAQFAEKYLGNPLYAYPLMLVVGTFMYVCATGTIPIAASLIMKGMTPGAGLIFLIVGPATNTATISFVGGKFGKKTTLIYILSIGVTALLSGLILDFVWGRVGAEYLFLEGGMTMLPAWIKEVSVLVLSLLLIRVFVKHIFAKKEKVAMADGMRLSVPNMTCSHCTETVDRAIRGVGGVSQVSVNLSSKLVTVSGNVEKKDIFDAVKSVNYTPEEVT